MDKISFFPQISSLSHRKNMLNKVFWMDCSQAPTKERKPEGLGSEKPCREYSYLAGTVDLTRLYTGYSYFISLYLHKDYFSISESMFQHIHLAVHCSVNSIYKPSVHMLCIQWHHASLCLPKLSPYSTDHQNRASESPWGRGPSSKLKAFAGKKGYLMFHPVYFILSHSYQI